MSDVTTQEVPPVPAPPATAAGDVDAVYAAIGTHGDARAKALGEAQTSLEAAVALARGALERGVPLNLTEVARRAAVSKQTLYNHLPAELVAARAATPDGAPAPAPAGPDAEETKP